MLAQTAGYVNRDLSYWVLPTDAFSALRQRHQLLPLPIPFAAIENRVGDFDRLPFRIPGLSLQNQ